MDTQTIFREIGKNNANEIEVNDNKKFILINRIGILVLLFVMGYIHYDLIINIATKPKEIKALIFPLSILLISFFSIWKAFWYKMFNTFLVVGFLFYSLFWFFTKNYIFFSIWIIFIGLLIYNITQAKLYWLNKVDAFLIKLR